MGGGQEPRHAIPDRSPKDSALEPSTLDVPPLVSCGNNDLFVFDLGEHESCSLFPQLLAHCLVQSRKLLFILINLIESRTTQEISLWASP